MYRPFSFGVPALIGLLLTPFPAHALTESQQDAAIASLQSTVAGQQTTINALLAKLKYVTTAGTDMTISGANLHVVSGSGHTNSAPNGLGNVIIGYDETRAGNGAVNTRTGSHNLILGAGNNFSSYGGLVAGYGNAISGIYATVTGGRGNAASGQFTSVGGGQNFAASADTAFLPTSASQSTIQSFQNQITSLQSTTSSLQTSVAGATAITNLFALSNGVGTKTELTLTGVNLHIVNGLGATNGEPQYPYDQYGAVVNGLGNLILGYNETRTSDPYGGSGTDTRTGSHNLILGDETNYSSYGGIIAGDRNGAEKPFASVTGGYDNTASGVASSVSGGDAVTEETNYGWAGGSLHSP